MPSFATPAPSAGLSFGHLELCVPVLRWVYRDYVDPALTVRTQEISRHSLICWLFIEGGVEVLHPGGSIQAGPGDIILCREGLATRWAPRTQLVSIRLIEPADQALRLFKFGDHLLLREADIPEFAAATRALGAWAAQNIPGARTALRAHLAEPAAWFSLQVLYAEWLGWLHKVMSRRGRVLTPRAPLDDRLVRALEFLHQDPRVSGRELAAHVGLSLSQLQRLFRTQLDRSINRAADEARLRLAQASLAAPHARIKDAAARVGFASAQTFARWFRKHSGCSPAEYRDQAGLAV